MLLMKHSFKTCFCQLTLYSRQNQEMTGWQGVYTLHFGWALSHNQSHFWNCATNICQCHALNLNFLQRTQRVRPLELQRLCLAAVLPDTLSFNAWLVTSRADDYYWPVLSAYLQVSKADYGRKIPRCYNAPSSRSYSIGFRTRHGAIDI